MLQKFHLQQRCHQVPRFSGEVPKQPGLHLYDLRSQDVWDHFGVWEFWVGAWPNASRWCVLPLRQAGDLGWLPWRWARSTSELQREGEPLPYRRYPKYSSRFLKKRGQAVFKVMLPWPAMTLWTRVKSSLKFLFFSKAFATWSTDTRKAFLTHLIIFWCI